MATSGERFPFAVPSVLGNRLLSQSQMPEQPKKCAVCAEPLTLEVTLARGRNNRILGESDFPYGVFWPPVMLYSGSVGHVECFWKAGLLEVPPGIIDARKEAEDLRKTPEIGIPLWGGDNDD